MTDGGSYAFAGVRPETMGVRPGPGHREAHSAQGRSWAIDDIGLIEINEAFAVQVLAFTRPRSGMADDDPRVNPYGGAIAVGHPLAASGARLVGPARARQFGGAPGGPLRADHPVRRASAWAPAVVWENPQWSGARAGSGREEAQSPPTEVVTRVLTHVRGRCPRGLGDARPAHARQRRGPHGKPNSFGIGGLTSPGRGSESAVARPHSTARTVVALADHRQALLLPRGRRRRDRRCR